jgi:PKD repeat protein
MKTLLTAFCSLVLILNTGINIVIGQPASRLGKVKTGNTEQSEYVTGKMVTESIKENPNRNFIVSGLSVRKPVGKSIDTLHYPLTGTYSLYVSAQNGYVTGNNEYGDRAKADLFQTSQDYLITGMLIKFAYAVGGNPDIQVAIWDNGGSNNSPGIIKGSATVSLNTIKNDVANQQMTYIEFGEPVVVMGPFYAGVVLPATTGDTLAIWSNTDGDTDPGIAWEMWESGDWIPMSSNQSWGLNLGQAIFPIVNTETPLYAEFSVSDATPQAGQTITFQDLSSGNPTSWSWIFESGEPATSALQNPQVTYPDTGIFDVTLIVGADTIFDTLVKQEYIQVSESGIEIDTLNYPLAGTYAVYWLPETGYISGNNVFGDLAKANFFANGQNLFITGLLCEFAYATGGNPDIEIAVWNQSITSGTPGSKIASKTIPMDAIKNDIQSEAMTYIPLNPPVNITSSFFAGVILPTATGDTLVVWSNMDGDTDPGIAWEMWDTGQWYSFSETTNSWGINVALAIFPIVQNTLGVQEWDGSLSTSIFPNPSDGIFRIKREFQAGSQVIAHVIATDGSLVYQRSFMPEQKIIIDLSGKKSGIYILRLDQADKVSFQKLIVK